MTHANRARCITGACLVVLIAGLVPPSAAAEEAQAEPRPMWLQALDNDYYKISLDIRARFGAADQDGLDDSQAWTVRTRAGIGSKPFYGFSGFAELENTFSLNDDQYFDVASAPNGRTPIGDPENTELNRAWLQYQNDDWAGLKLKGGRQRIIFDDSRFIGNVGWRQNEQTYDSALAQTDFGVEGLKATYAYLWEIRRIFGDQGPPGTRDFDSDSHLINVKYGKLPRGASIAGFVYLLDFDNSPGNSSNSYGFRLTGAEEVGGGAKLSYIFSYAYQTDGGNNPVSYGAHYVNAEAGLGFGQIGTLKVGYELLGSDDGKARFVTPLSTAHKFNGYADVFLNNGGPNGLQDLYVSLVPKLPWNLKGFITYHHFWSHENGTNLGDEVDFVLKRAFGKHIDVLTKGAYFFGASSGPADIWRYTLEVNFRY